MRKKRKQAVKSILVGLMIVGLFTISGKAMAATCTHPLTFLGIDSEVIDTYVHSFYYYFDYDNDGKEELIVDACTVTITEYWYVEACPKCGYQCATNEESWYTYKHSEENNTYHTYE